jgi:two-component system chemotaxis response regulator CheB
MGQDGLIGAGAIRDAGGQMLAQDEATSVVWGMPGAVASAGLADQVLPLDQIAAELVHRAGIGRLPRLPGPMKPAISTR